MNLFGICFPDLSSIDRINSAFIELRGISEVATLATDVHEYRYERPFRIVNKGHSGVFNLLSQGATKRKTVWLIYKGGKEQIACPYLVGSFGSRTKLLPAIAVFQRNSIKVDVVDLKREHHKPSYHSVTPLGARRLPLSD